jgi:hypothetical protein
VNLALRVFSWKNVAGVGMIVTIKKITRKSIVPFLLLLAAVLWAMPGCAASQSPESPAGEAHPALKDAVILIIRHAEKPDDGYELSPAGRQRAEAYAQYFKTFALDSKPLKPDYLFATADTKSSHRPRLTLEPLSSALGMKIDLRFRTKNPQAFVQEIQSHSHGQHILIAWHHGEIPEIVQLLGANPASLLPAGKWPADEYSWVLMLRYDHDGRLLPAETKCIHEKLMPGDS